MVSSSFTVKPLFYFSKCVNLLMFVSGNSNFISLCGSDSVGCFSLDFKSWSFVSLFIYLFGFEMMVPNTLAWKIPWMEEPERLQFMGLLRVGHDWATSLSLFTFMHWRRKWHPHSSVLAWRIPGMGEPGGLPSVGSQSRTRLKWLSSSSSSSRDLSVEHFESWI